MTDHTPSPDPWELDGEPNLRRVADLLETSESSDRELVAPPSGLFERILAETAAAPDELPAQSGTANAEPTADAPGAAVIPMGVGKRSGRRITGAATGGAPRRWLAAAAAVVLIAGLVAAVWRSTNGPDPLATVELSGAGLEEGSSIPGTARLLRDHDHYELAVELPRSITPSTGYLELWLIDTSVKGMVSLGPIEGSGTYQVPSGVNPESFPVVDVSEEPADGLPTHSGHSVLRGVLHL